ncbi:MAG: Mrp/NBP35 family ATP-binding protein [Alphaproteobacteria bacterium]
MSQVGEEQVRTALGGVTDPGSGKSIVELDMVSGVVIRDGNVGFSIEIDPARAQEMEPVRKAAEDAVLALPGVSSVTAVLTADRPAATAGARQPHAATPSPGRRDLAPDVDKIVAIASGKGGVGKSTTAVNLALALSRLERSVGLLDADIYGPSMPRMMGIREKPQSPDGKRILPLENHGVRVMSMGFMVPEDTPMIWRGPMVMGALEQMLRDVEWGRLDILVVDMPPGTGDAQLTMAQRVPLAGAVIISTPQDIALLDARKGLNMFKRVDVPVLGIIENMSYFACPHCGERSEIFGHGGAREEAARLGCDFLGEIPLDIDIRRTSDDGQPIVASRPDSPLAGAYAAIAERVVAKLEGSELGARGAPRIIMQ